MSMIPVRPEIAAGAHIGSLEEYKRLYRLSLDDPEGFWRKQSEIVTWFHPPSTILDFDMKEVDFSWYGGGRINACFNCVDRHLPTQGDKTAIIWAGDEPGEYRTITYSELKHHVARLANVRGPGGALATNWSRPAGAHAGAKKQARRQG